MKKIKSYICQIDEKDSVKKFYEGNEEWTSDKGKALSFNDSSESINIIYNYLKNKGISCEISSEQ